ncbi:hypothetical protein AB4357_04605 [Vibrio lentus]
MTSRLEQLKERRHRRKPPVNRERNFTAEPSENNSITAFPIPINELKVEVHINGCAEPFVLQFKRLAYFGCPRMKRDGSGTLDCPKKVFMPEREPFIRRMHALAIKAKESEVLSGAYQQLAFNNLVYFVRYFEGKKRPLSFDAEDVKWYINNLKQDYGLNKISIGTYKNSRAMLSMYLKLDNRTHEAKELSPIKSKKGDLKASSIMNDSDYVDANKILSSAYTVYIRHITEGTTPEYCPIYSRELLSAMKDEHGEYIYDDKDLEVFYKKAKLRISSGDWRNNLIRIAFILVSKQIGANTTPLSTLKINQVVFDNKGIGDNHTFDAQVIKGRDDYNPQLLKMGFTANARRTIESWIDVTKILKLTGDDYLFPRIDKDGTATILQVNFQAAINKALSPYKLTTRVNNQNLRGTRSTLNIRATGDIKAAAEANGNAVSTTLRSYLDSDANTSNLELAGAFEAQYKISHSGIDNKENIINEIRAEFKDPMSDFEYRMETGKIANLTTTGPRCSKMDSDKANKSIRKYRDIDQFGDTTPCIEFLECFTCPYHVLISEVEDIWVMMSFKEVILDCLNRPSYGDKLIATNEKLLDIAHLVKRALSKLFAHNSVNYKEAEDKINRGELHPLYDSEYAIDDIKEGLS